MKAIRNWWNKLIYEEYELTVWFDGGSSEDKDGNLTPHPKSKKGIFTQEYQQTDTNSHQRQ